MFAKSVAASCILDIGVGGYFSPVIIDREFEFYEFFSFLKFNEFYEFFFSVKKNSQKIRNFANHRCLTCFDVLECNVHL